MFQHSCTSLRKGNFSWSSRTKSFRTDVQRSSHKEAMGKIHLEVEVKIVEALLHSAENIKFFSVCFPPLTHGLYEDGWQHRHSLLSLLSVHLVVLSHSKGNIELYSYPSSVACYFLLLSFCFIWISAVGCIHIYNCHIFVIHWCFSDYEMVYIVSTNTLVECSAI